MIFKKSLKIKRWDIRLKFISLYLVLKFIGLLIVNLCISWNIVMKERTHFWKWLLSKKRNSVWRGSFKQNRTQSLGEISILRMGKNRQFTTKDVHGNKAREETETSLRGTHRRNKKSLWAISIQTVTATTINSVHDPTPEPAIVCV